jgi:uncharacterized membrane protein YhaH (DUF805 family)
MAQPSDEVSHPGGIRLGGVPLLRPIIWFRFFLGVLSCLGAVALLIYGFEETHQGGEMFQVLADEIFAGVIVICALLALIGLASLHIAVGLGRQRPRAARRAVIFDLIVVTLTVIGLALWGIHFLIGGGDLADEMPWSGAFAALALVLAVEASCLLRGVWAWAHAWRVFSLVAGGLAFLAVIAPVSTNQILIRHVRPVLAHIDANWVRIPEDSRVSVISRSKNSSGAYDYNIFVDTRLGHRHVHVQLRSDGRWYFPASDPEHDALDVCVRGDVRISTIPAARKLLDNGGVVDRNLGPARVTQLYAGCTEYAFWSPRARGVYKVQDQGAIGLFLKKPLVVPLQTGVRERSGR